MRNLEAAPIAPFVELAQSHGLALNVERMTVSPNEEIAALEKGLFQLPQGTCPVRHTFSPGLYIRTITMQAGLFIIGAEHLTEHPNIVHTGKALVLMDGQVVEITAPSLFISEPGVRKVLLIVETMEWTTIHANPDDTRDIDVIEARTIRKTPAHLEHEAQMKALTEHAKQRGMLL